MALVSALAISATAAGAVLRLGDPTPPPGSTRTKKVRAQLTKNQVARLIKRQRANLNRCQRYTRGRAGKVLLTVRISHRGRVSSTVISAPNFRGTRLPECLSQGASAWRFPRFRSGAIEYTFPLIFR